MILGYLLAAVLTAIPQEEIAHLLPDYAQPKYSANEEMLAYLAPDERGAYNLHVDGKCLTQRRRAISSFHWEKDNDHLLYLYEEGDENHHLYRTDLQGNEEDLTPFQNIHVEFVGVDESRALIRMNLRDPRYLDCYIIHLDTKEIEPISPMLDHREQITVWNDDLQVAVNMEPSGEKILEVCEKGVWRSVCDLDPEDWYVEILKFTPDHQKIRILSSLDLPTRSLYEIDLKTGSRELLFSHPKLDCTKAYFHPETGNLQAACVRDDLLQWVFFDPEFESEIHSIEKRVGEGEVLLLSRLSKDRKWFFVHRQDNRPNAYYLWNRDTKEQALVLQEAPHLLDYSLGKMRPIHFQARDGQEIQGYLLLPPSGEPPYPTILQVHGGPHLRDVWGFMPQSQYWASRGYAVLFINYRSSFGFGKQFFMADRMEWGGRVFEDLIDGKRWAVQDGWTDPDKVAIKGGSYGGYMALLGVSLTPDEFICGISDCPMVESSWMPKGYVIWGFTYDKLFREGAIRAISPLSYANQIKVPLFMTHGENDLRVRPEQSQKMAELLPLYRIPFIYHLLPGEGHLYSDPDNRRFYLKEVDAFLSESFK